MRRKLIIANIIIIVTVICSFFYPTRTQLLAMKHMFSIRIYDRNHVLLREVLSQQDATSRYVSLENISPWLVHATLCSEDKRFFLHNGIDILAIMRAFVQNTMHGTIVSGGSTITQQVARNILGSPNRSLLYKYMEALFAVNMETKLSKEEILELYFNYAPYGNQVHGIEAASYLYFRKPARDLSLLESVFLAGIPKAPSRYNPYKYPDRVASEAQHILTLLYDNQIINETTYTRTSRQSVVLTDPVFNFKAPHFCEYVLEHMNHIPVTQPAEIVTTLDYHIQEEMESILKNNIDRLSDANVTNAAAIVIERRSMDICGYVGSVDFFDPVIDGEVDGVRALRQPGSTLKPFTYALALEKGAHAATLIPDIPTYESTFGGDYQPRNYDNKYHGMVRLRTALACSYNIPAVRVCGNFGTEMLLDRLHTLGFQSLDESPIHYGVGLTLGNGEVTLLELTRAYGTLAHYGSFVPLRIMRHFNDRIYPHSQPVRRIFTPHIAYLISDILADNQARSPAFGEYSPLNLPFFCAVKTGTSKDYRDNWCMGYTDDYLIGVWVGNFDGSPMHMVSGITGAAPIFRDIILMLHRDSVPCKPIPPSGFVYRKICSITGYRASPSCENCMEELFVPESEPVEICKGHSTSRLSTFHLASLETETDIPTKQFVISFPDNQDIFKIDPILRNEHQRLRFRVNTDYSLQHVTWYVDDINIGTASYPYSILWQLSSGDHVIVAQGVTHTNETIQAPPVTITVLK